MCPKLLSLEGYPREWALAPQIVMQVYVVTRDSRSAKGKIAEIAVTESFKKSTCPEARV